MLEYARDILDHPFLYEFYHTIIGANFRSRVLIQKYIRPKPGDRILDIGCGPGNMIPFLPECDYLGVDANKSYIAAARRRYSDRGKFLCERVSQHAVHELGTFDIVLALGLVHHLEDAEAKDLFRLGHTALKPGGRMITMDGCYVEKQSIAKRYFLSRDRGRFVRTQEQYERLAHASFQDVRAELRHDVLRIPYTTLFLECVS
jgi:cyclopropane fatty-acyl-phospholipid synthase-like methyltransferase